jgi:hypothetical protein
MPQTEKPPEVSQAQTAAYIAQSEMAPQYKRWLLAERLGKDALPLEGEDITVTTQPEKYFTNRDSDGQPIPVGTELTVATKTDYANFLREKGGMRNEEVTGRAELLAAYADFAPSIDALLQEISGLEKPEDHPNHLGGGVASRAYTLQHEGKEYVAIVPRFAESALVNMDSRMVGTIRGKTTPQLEKMAAASYDTGITISERMPGKPIGKLSLEDIAAIKPEHVAAFAATLQAAAAKGVSIDFVADGGNFLYDPEAGFGIIDIGALSSPANMEYLTNKALEVPLQLGMLDTSPYDSTKRSIRARAVDAIQQQLEAALAS